MPVWIDIVIVLVLLGCLVHGLQRGFVGSIGSIAGVVAGGIAAWFVAPPVGALLQDGVGQTILSLVVALALVLVGRGLGRRLASAVERPLRRSPLAPVDRVLGAGVQVLVGALVVSVIASLAVSIGTPVVARAVGESVVSRRIASLTPAPVAQAVDRAEAAVLAAGAGAASPGPAPSTR